MTRPRHLRLVESDSARERSPRKPAQLTFAVLDSDERGEQSDRWDLDLELAELRDRLRRSGRSIG